MIVLLVIALGACLFFLFNHPGHTQKAVRKIIEEREKRRFVCREILRPGDKVRHNERKCKVIKINYLSETLDIRDLETGELLTIPFLSISIEPNP